MLNSVLFLFSMMVGGGLIFAAGSVAGVKARSKRGGWGPAERDSMRIALEFSLFTMIFALLPLLLAYMLQDRAALWMIASIMMVIFLAAELARIILLAQEYGIRWPLVTASLLVLSVILLTIELVNVFWWQALPAYAVGVGWLFLLAGVQTIAFVCYDRIPTLDNKIHPANPPDAAFHGAMGQRMRRDHHADHPHQPPDSRTNRYRDPVKYARSQRHLNRSRSRR